MDRKASSSSTTPSVKAMRDFYAPWVTQNRHGRGIVKRGAAVKVSILYASAASSSRPIRRQGAAAGASRSGFPLNARMVPISSKEDEIGIAILSPAVTSASTSSPGVKEEAVHSHHRQSSATTVAPFAVIGNVDPLRGPAPTAPVVHSHQLGPQGDDGYSRHTYCHYYSCSVGRLFASIIAISFAIRARTVRIRSTSNIMVRDGFLVAPAYSADDDECQLARESGRASADGRSIIMGWEWLRGQDYVTKLDSVP
ncbi:hypothetical protein PG991_010380 [Apiospora marii]|uniref:Uncharacterized protein n=1 Tax=Apiospora marii TaxID=335849 RepID=A0ABR1RIC4_9PEZI